MFERFTDRSRRVLVLAQEQARELRHGFIGTEHILLGLIQEGEGVAAKVLRSLDIALPAVQESVLQIIGPGRDGALVGSPPFTPRAKKVLELSLREALQLGHNYIGTEHILLGLLREGQGVGAQVLAGLGAELRLVRVRVLQVMSDAAAASSELAVDAAELTRAEHPVEPATLLTTAEVEAVLEGTAGVGDMVRGSHQVGGTTYATCSFKAKPRPEVSIAVADATVTRAAFDAFAAAHAARSFVAVDGVGDTATFEEDTGALRVLVGSTLLVVTVRRHPEPLAAATALARAAAARVTAG